jgi:homoserine O-acetyltransferase
VEALHDMNLSTPAHYALAYPPEKFAANYAEYFKTGILPFDANDWLYQLEAMIHHDAAHGTSMDEAEKRVKAHVLVVVAAQDHMVNPMPAEDFAKAIGARIFVLDSNCGHISTTCEAGKLDPVVRAFLDGR